ncbi:unnamed protein product, partial [Polarella glacialis]
RRPALGQRADIMHLKPGGGCDIVDVWSWNFDAEFGELLAAVSACGDNALLALDTEFPGFLREERKSATRSARYDALRENCGRLKPIQIGISVASSDGTLMGTWSFNLAFDLSVDMHTEESVAFLSAAGLDFPRLAAEGIDLATVGRRLASCPLVGSGGRQPCWVTFQGWYDFGYILRLITNWPLPQDVSDFDEMLATFFPQRYELRDEMPHGSLDTLLHKFGVERFGTPHTAGSDALATLELFLKVRHKLANRSKIAGGDGCFHDAGVRKAVQDGYQSKEPEKDRVEVDWRIALAAAALQKGSQLGLAASGWDARVQSLPLAAPLGDFLPQDGGWGVQSLPQLQHLQPLQLMEFMLPMMQAIHSGGDLFFPNSEFEVNNWSPSSAMPQHQPVGMASVLLPSGCSTGPPMAWGTPAPPAECWGPGAGAPMDMSSDMFFGMPAEHLPELVHIPG